MTTMPVRLAPAKACAIVAVAAAAGLTPGATGQVRLALQRVGGTASFSFPIALAQPPGETRRLYIAGQYGPVWVVRDEVRLPAPFMDLSTVVIGGSEAGLLGIAFHPDFQSNGFLYVCYSGGRNGAPAGTYIARYHTDPANPEAVTPGSATPVFYASRLVGLHNGGWIGFGPGGYLYVATGDAGNDANSQNLASLHGKLLRIDVNGDDFPDPSRNYAIPPTNPFFGSATIAPEIWSMGLRNPWRCSVDRLTGDLWIGDVGDGSAGEIDFQTASAAALPVRNYGWPCLEGLVCRGGTVCSCTNPAMIPPVYDVGRPPGTAATTGGYVYRGSAIPDFYGAYLFADYAGPSWSLRYDGTTVSEFTSRCAELGPGSWSSVGEDSAGELYLCNRNGAVYKVVRACDANCDGSNLPPLLNVNDFVCFQSRFAAQDPYGDCDRNGVLNVNDFVCFQAAFAAGCP